MSDESKVRYRSAVVSIAQGLCCDEAEVGNVALALARSAQSVAQYNWEDLDPKAAQSHVGYYLIGEGLALLERAIKSQKITHKYAITRFLKKHAQGTFISVTIFLWLLLILACAVYASMCGAEKWGIAVLVILLSLSLLGVAEQIVLAFCGTFLPRKNPVSIKFSSGIPEKAKTAVVVHEMLDSPSRLIEAVSLFKERLVNNQDPNLVFVLCIDPMDSATTEVPSDKILQELSTKLFGELNTTLLASDAPQAIVLFRKRRWSKTQQSYIGWDRKRGKIQQLNELLLYDKAEPFVCPSGNINLLKSIRFIISLDADSFITLEDSRKLIETIAHPLNLPLYDPTLSKVVRGYGVIQPYIYSYQHGGKTEVLKDRPSFNPNATLDSSMFELSLYVGKGIYDVHPFYQATSLIPEENFISHDILEGALTRVIATSCSIIMERSPANSISSLQRFHRWARGDFQLVPWLLPPSARPCSLPTCSFEPYYYWIMFLRMRRSKGYFALLLSLSPIVFPGHTFFWIFLFTMIFNFEESLDLFKLTLNAIFKSFSIQKRFSVMFTLWKNLSRQYGRLVFFYVIAWTELDALCRTLWRVFISRLNLLEWTSSSHIENIQNNKLIEKMIFMYKAFPLPLLAFLSMISTKHYSPWIIITIFVWLFSPYCMSLPVNDSE